MKCPACNYQNPPARQQCVKCGSALTQASVAAPSRSTPDWRREVSEKVRAYGERKKLLTTPPRPLKEHLAEQDETPPPDFYDPPPIVLTPPVSSLETEPFETFIPSADHRFDPEPQRESSPEPVEISSDDLLEFDVPQTESESPKAQSYIARRMGALLSDTAILIVLVLVLLTLISKIMDVEILSMAATAWPVYLSVFLAWHLVYYLYFYKSSRQTPGQVFFGLELRDPSSSEIPTSKILIRWIAMIVLNVFNAIPLFFNKTWLLADRLSGTEIRSFK